ncbi:MAG: hypothetical protein ACI8TX_001098 [Hyphomicrobiaceae bacterium]|jgi:hypothetical protein
MRSLETGACWQATYDAASTKKNTQKLFKAAAK